MDCPTNKGRVSRAAVREGTLLITELAEEVQIERAIEEAVLKRAFEVKLFGLKQSKALPGQVNTFLQEFSNAEDDW